MSKPDTKFFRGEWESELGRFEIIYVFIDGPCLFKKDGQFIKKNFSELEKAVKDKKIWRLCTTPT
jgi:hypothetical protein